MKAVGERDWPQDDCLPTQGVGFDAIKSFLQIEK
jgi:hypothetical protein